MGHGKSTMYTQLTDADVEYLEQNTKFDEKTIRKWWTDFQGGSPKGKMTSEQLKTLCKMVLPPTVDIEKFGNHLFKTFDVDKDGYLNFNEFLFGLCSSSHKEETQKLKNIFKLYDIDGDNVITFGEVVTILKASYGEFEEGSSSSKINHKAGEMMLKLDRNQDGVVTQEEFLQVLQKKEEKDKKCELITIN